MDREIFEKLDDMSYDVEGIHKLLSELSEKDEEYDFSEIEKSSKELSVIASVLNKNTEIMQSSINAYLDNTSTEETEENDILLQEIINSLESIDISGELSGLNDSISSAINDLKNGITSNIDISGVEDISIKLENITQDLMDLELSADIDLNGVITNIEELKTSLEIPVSLNPLDNINLDIDIPEQEVSINGNIEPLLQSLEKVNELINSASADIDIQANINSLEEIKNNISDIDIKANISTNTEAVMNDLIELRDSIDFNHEVKITPIYEPLELEDLSIDAYINTNIDSVREMLNNEELTIKANIEVPEQEVIETKEITKEFYTEPVISEPVYEVITDSQSTDNTEVIAELKNNSTLLQELIEVISDINIEPSVSQITEKENNNSIEINKTTVKETTESVNSNMIELLSQIKNGIDKMNKNSNRNTFKTDKFG